MFDPRNDIKGLFTNNRISASDKYGNNDYVEIVIGHWKNQPEQEIRYAGVLFLEDPRCVLEDATIGGDRTEYTLIVDANLFVRKKKNIRDYWSFVNSVVNTFETTIRSNRANLSSCDDCIVTNVLSPPSESGYFYRRVIEITCKKIS